MTFRRRSTGVAAVVMALALVASVVAAGASRAAAGPSVPSATCTTPSTVTGFTPQQLAQRYGIAPLVASGADGRGVTIVILEQGQSADLSTLATWEACMGVTGPQVTQTLVGGGSMPANGDEAQADVEVVAGLVPGADVRVLVTNGSMTSLWDAVLDPSLTGGRTPDIVSSSYGKCESAAVSSGEVTAGDAAIARMAAAGIWFLKSAGDEGSDDCRPKDTCPPTPGSPNVEYPTSNPLVTGVGGTQIDSGATTGTASVWNKLEPPSCLGGGGGQSVLYQRPAFQAGVGPAAVTGRMVPDITGLAGEPAYQILHPDGWSRIVGTSLSTPLYAAGMAAVRSQLLSVGLPVPASLNEVLYRAAADPATYAAVFDDVVLGDDDLLGVGCCTATAGYDMASGLGEVHLDALAAWLVAELSPTTTTTTTPAPPAAVVPSFTG